MRNKLLTVVMGVGVVLVSCAPNPSNFYIKSLFPLVDVCDYSDPETYFSPNGFLDVAPGNPQFFIGVNIGGGETISQPPITVSGRILEQENRDRPLLKTQTVKYRFGKSVPIATVPYVTNFATQFGETGEVIGPIQLLSPEIGQALFDFLPPSDSLEDAVDLFVDVEFSGVMSGSGTPISTGIATYPIKVFRSNGATCANPLENACKYLGQSTYQLYKPGYACAAAP